MASEQSKSSSSPQEGVQPPSVTHYPPQYNGQYLPPPGAFPPYYTYASIQDGSHDPNAPNGAPPIPQYVMAAFPRRLQAWCMPIQRRTLGKVSAESLSMLG
ncbi:hypothetical protein A0H81_12215 [Grifola frondosa]|uniref:Uncharacterized protein n=1 Tax=Grifola frondosa TaxID=5627 RepID=A0A1C7LU13_GRIFR|nr:hypothetical protein A0H81_12215 [Grifola frondosa]